MGSLQLQNGRDPSTKNICKNSPPKAPASGTVRMRGAGSLTQQTRPLVWVFFLFFISRAPLRGWGSRAELLSSEPLCGM